VTGWNEWREPENRQEKMRNLIVLLAVIASIVGPSIVIGRIAGASIQALGRNPSSAPKILMAMIVALVFTESLAVIALLMMFQAIGQF